MCPPHHDRSEAKAQTDFLMSKEFRALADDTEESSASARSCDTFAILLSTNSPVIRSSLNTRRGRYPIKPNRDGIPIGRKKTVDETNGLRHSECVPNSSTSPRDENDDQIDRLLFGLQLVRR